MKEQLIEYKTAELASDKGFDWKHSDFYIDKRIAGNNTEIGCVPQSLLQKWLREIHNYHIEVYFDPWATETYDYSIKVKGDKDYHYDSPRDFKSYEDALEDGLAYALNAIRTVSKTA